jgi:hypothetical protein
LQIQIARLSGGLIVPAELRRAQIRLIGTRTGRDVLLQRALFVAGQGHRQRRDDLTRQIVLQREQIAERGLRPVRPLDGAGWRVHELGANPELVTDTHQRRREHRVNFQRGGERFQIGCGSDEPGGGER